MGSKTDGNKCKYLLSHCCKSPVRFETKSGFSVDAWCEKCGNYVFTGRIEALISLKLGDLQSYRNNYNGFNPDWIKDNIQAMVKSVKIAKELVETLNFKESSDEDIDVDVIPKIKEIKRILGEEIEKCN